MKIVFAGTPDFAVAPLKNIIDNGFEVVGVITQTQDMPLRHMLMESSQSM